MCRKVFICLLCAIGVGSVRTRAQTPPTYAFQTLAGLAPTSPFYFAYALTVDASGNVYVFDANLFASAYGGVVSKVTPSGQVTLLAGGGSPDDADGTATAAGFGLGYGITVTSDGTLYAADSSFCTIRKITPNAVVTTLAGVANLCGSADGIGSAARFDWPQGLAVDGSGNVYVADTNNHTIRKITSSGVVTTIAGQAGASGSADGIGASARFARPTSLALGSDGSLYVADSGNYTLRKVTTDGVVTTFAGAAGTSGSVDGTGSAARFVYANRVTIDGSGTLYVADSCTIRKVTAAAVVTTLAGSSVNCGTQDGVGSAARLNNVSGVAATASGTVYFLQALESSPLRAVAPDGTVTTIFPEGALPNVTNGTGSAARFSSPQGVAFGRGTIFEGDSMVIRAISPAGVVGSFAQLIDGILGVSVAADGSIYVALRCAVQKVTATGSVIPLAGVAPAVTYDGSAACGSVDGTGTAARFNNPIGLAADEAGTVYVADSANATIRTVSSSGVVTTFAGQAGSTGTTDASGSAARFNAPAGLVRSVSGTLYVADRGNHAIRAIAPGGVVTTFAGLGGTSGSTDGTGVNARFNEPYGLAIDTSGNLYVTEVGNSTIRMITPAGVVTTIGGTAGLNGNVDAVGAAARFRFPRGITVDTSGTLYIADTGNHTIRLGFSGTAAVPVITTHPTSQTANGGQTIQFIAAASGNPAPGYQWQSSTDGVSWSNLLESSPYSGIRTSTLTIVASSAVNGRQYRAVAANLLGSATTTAATLVVNSVDVNHTALYFGGVRELLGAPPVIVIATVTPAQEVAVTFSGSVSPSTTWTAVADRPWVQITNGAGTGRGSFIAAILKELVDSTTTSATIAVTAGGGTLTTTVSVTLTLSCCLDAVPFGAFDTPLTGSTARGSIAVTGWALDEVGVQRVEIWRNCVETIDRPKGACFASTPGGPANFVFIGTGAFLAGARPDVEAIFSNRPIAYRAGWGYLMLTNALPHQPGGTAQGGQGTFTLSAYAVDVKGQYALLGQKTITLDNDHATIPFGAIDTPDQGGTVPGPAFPYNDPAAYPVFGWAMTQTGKCIDTTSTASYRMYIDGVQQTLVSGTNWFSGLNRSDLAAAFPGLCNSTNGLAAYYMDVRPLSNGLHTIGWDVIDDQGKVAGIGSRFFTVLK